MQGYETAVEPRILPLAPAEWTPRVVRELLVATRANPAKAEAETPVEVNIYSTFVRHPRLFEPWRSVAHALLFDGQLPPRERELAILRTAWRADCDYMWAQHRRHAANAGISEEEVEAVAVEDVSAWSDDDRLVLVASDELTRDADLSTETWSALRRRWSEEDVMEFVVLVGGYRLTASMLNSFRVPLDEGTAGFS
ncbi:carboxymuconolactone decarboxylase family protein [Aeromicrobium sp. PE09-221]|uniref:carboxymuconolactone decarboxylase family protein n=1 Tax=Aeromicrobium sp. PE09-221 TaxID=1898043 RepID=UPI000B3E7CBE|nr:carboxymuconolactone decarboxylase family protein [Aeromicrobium sp. PE09-221]